MEVNGHTSPDKLGQPFHAPALARSRALAPCPAIPGYTWLEVEYRRLKLKHRIAWGRLQRQFAANKELARRLDMESMNGDCIMECRALIQHELGINAVRLPGLNINSPFFDDLIGGIVHRLKAETARADHAEASLGAVTQSYLTSQQSAQQAMLQQVVMQQAQQTGTAQLNWMNASGGSGGIPIASITNPVWMNATTSTTSATNTLLISTGTPYAAMVGTNMTDTDQQQLDMISLSDNRAQKVKLPDGAIVDVKRDGSYVIRDIDAKIVYRANRLREFNRYLNASDLVGEFIKFCGEEAQVHREEMLDLPLKLFISFLVIEAARADGEPEPADIKLVPDVQAATHPVCLGCGSPLPASRRISKINFCRAACLDRYDQQDQPALQAAE